MNTIFTIFVICVLVFSSGLVLKRKGIRPSQRKILFISALYLISSLCKLKIPSIICIIGIFFWLIILCINELGDIGYLPNYKIVIQKGRIISEIYIDKYAINDNEVIIIAKNQIIKRFDLQTMTNKCNEKLIDLVSARNEVIIKDSKIMI